MLLKDGLTLEIAKAKKEDAAELIEYLNLVGGESDNLTFGANEFKLTVQQEEEYIEGLSEKKTTVMLVGRVNGKIASTGMISGYHIKRFAHNADLAISVKKEFWAKGVGYEMMTALIDFCRQTEVLKVVHLEVRKDNENAIKLYKKCGFSEVGQHKNFFCIGGEFCDSIIMELVL